MPLVAGIVVRDKEKKKGGGTGGNACGGQDIKVPGRYYVRTIRCTWVNAPKGEEVRGPLGGGTSSLHRFGDSARPARQQTSKYLGYSTKYFYTFLPSMTA